MRKLPPSSDLARLLAGYADTLRDEGKLAEAEPLYREGLDICRRLAANDLEARQWLASCLALTLQNQGRLAEAEPFYREALTNSAKIWPNDFKRWEWQYNQLVDVLQHLGKSNEVESLRREAQASGWNWQPSGHSQSSLASEGDQLRAERKFTEAESVYLEGLEMCRQMPTNNPEIHQWLASGLALALESQSKLAEAEPFYREALTNSANLWPNNFKRWEWQFNDLVDVLQHQGKSNEVEQLRNEFLPLTKQSQSPTPGTNENNTAGHAP
jgi:tetratricopeptide (TPR) repeat protein